MEEIDKNIERLIIKNFACIEELELDINKNNIYIGSSASGKSITIKLIYYFKDIFNEILETILDSESKYYLKQRLKEKFIELFPYECMGDKDFELIFYFNETDFVKIGKIKNKNVKIEISKNIDKSYTYGKKVYNRIKNEIRNNSDEFIYEFEIKNKVGSLYTEYIKKNININCGNRQIFIPAGRAFFATLQSSIFSLLSKSKSIDPFLVKFGSFYERIKGIVIDNDVVRINSRFNDFGIDKKIEKILGGKYNRIKSTDVIIHQDKRNVNLTYASSGQQEILPLLMTLKALSVFHFSGLTFYIEEPEAHLFPTAQKNVIELIISVLNNLDCNSELFVTTHSPYVVSTYNNLLFAGNVINDLNSDSYKNVYDIIPKENIVEVDITNAYSVENGKFKKIIDVETKIIDADYLDNASYCIDSEFDKLLNLDLDE